MSISRDGIISSHVSVRTQSMSVILWLIVADIALVIAFFVSTRMESRFNSMKPKVMLVKVESIVVGLMPITIVLIHLSNTIIAMIIYGFVEL